MKKTVILLLLFATLLAALAACASAPDTTPQESVNGESTEVPVLDHVPGDLKYDDEDIVILSRSMMGWTADEVAVPELNSEPVNDAIFNRNLTVNQRLGVNIVSMPIEDPNQFLPIEEIERAIKAGSEEYDLLAGAAYVVAPAVLKGYFYDLTELEYLDLEQDYWMQDYNRAMSFGQAQYSATGMIALSTYRFAFVTMFNKYEFDKAGLPYLYEAVNNNTWTLDYQAEITKNFYRDSNGSGTKDEGDFYGLISSDGINVDPYWASCDIPIVEKDSDGYYQYVMDVGRLSDVIDKVLYLMYDCGGTYVYGPIENNDEQNLMRIAFAKGECAMATLRLDAAERADIRNMEKQYGIVPMPKFDEQQKGYGTMMHDQFTVFAVPVSAAEDKLQMIGATMEVMASESQRTVRPAYYEIALKRKYMSDPIAWDMLDMIFADMKIDAAVVYTDSVGNPHHKMRQIVAGKRNNTSSSCAKLDKTVERALLKVHKSLEKLE